MTGRTSSSPFPLRRLFKISISSAASGYPIPKQIRNRSSWDWGNSWVPAEPTGFWVAMTRKGDGTGLVTPSTVTLPSSITSRSAAWVLGEVRLISSARRILHMTAPGRYKKASFSLLYTVKPVISAGKTSGVNCTLFCATLIALAKASARVVFPTPGTSSTSTCPPARMAVMSFSTHSVFPINAFFTSSITFCALFSCMTDSFCLSFVFPGHLHGFFAVSRSAGRWIPPLLPRSAGIPAATAIHPRSAS